MKSSKSVEEFESNPQINLRLSGSIFSSSQLLVQLSYQQGLSPEFVINPLQIKSTRQEIYTFKHQNNSYCATILLVFFIICKHLNAHKRFNSYYCHNYVVCDLCTRAKLSNLGQRLKQLYLRHILILRMRHTRL